MGSMIGNNVNNGTKHFFLITRNANETLFIFFLKIQTILDKTHDALRHKWGIPPSPIQCWVIQCKRFCDVRFEREQFETLYNIVWGRGVWRGGGVMKFCPRLSLTFFFIFYVFFCVIDCVCCFWGVIPFKNVFCRYFSPFLFIFSFVFTFIYCWFSMFELHTLI